MERASKWLRMRERVSFLSSLMSVQLSIWRKADCSENFSESLSISLRPLHHNAIADC